jgi:hypothetical protein
LSDLRDDVRRYGMACVAMWPLVSEPQNTTTSSLPPMIHLEVVGSTIYKSSAHPAIDLRREAMWRELARRIAYVKRRLVLDALGGR